MSGYVASARIVRAAPRLARADRVVDVAVRPPSAPTVEALILEPDAAPAGEWNRLLERARAVRERWSQLTFYLFDPNSWR